MKMVINVDENVFTRLFNNGMEDSEISKNDLKNKGYNVYIKFNNKYLYSDEDSDIDHACRKINGLSYEEFKKTMEKVKAIINIEKYKTDRKET